MDEADTVIISSLLRVGFFSGGTARSGTLAWEHYGQETGRLGITVDLSAGYVELGYNIDRRPVKYRVRLDGLRSNLGFGHVWYFICPATGRRCRKLYRIGSHLLSRYAFPSAVHSTQIVSKACREIDRTFGQIRTGDKIDRFLETPYRKTHYRGIPTRRFQRLLDRDARARRRSGFGTGMFGK